MSFVSAGEGIVAAVAAGLYRAGTEIMAASQPLVPVETGTLKRSGRVEEPVVEGDTVTVVVGYGYGEEYQSTAGEHGDTVGYGIYVHENLQARHAPPTQAKFLESPAAEYEAQFAGTLRAAVQERL